MRILLDECIPVQLGHDLVGHEVSTVQQMGWTGCKNGELLTRASERFEVFLTVDRNLPKQQKLDRWPIAVIVLRCATNDAGDLRKLIPAVLKALPQARKGTATAIG